VVGKVEAATIAGDHSTAIELMLTQCFTAARATIISLNELLELQKQTFDEGVLEQDKNLSKTVFMMIGIMLALTAITVFFAVKTILNILTGLGKAVEVSTKIGQGNLSETIDVLGNDEISQLMKSLKSMSINLQTLIKGIRYSVESLTNNSSSLRTSSEEMSKAATEQADATSSMAAAVELDLVKKVDS
jgi:methyl-accepting chemotaxis protein